VTLLTWNHECIVGVKAMDDQHGIIMDTLNDLRKMIVEGRDRKTVCEQLDRVIAFSQMHFQSEEHLLEKQGYPGLLEHREAHQRLLSRLQEATEHAKHSENGDIQALFHFLRAWYTEHIEQLDQPYGPWLNARGVD
jgi:hemerythrin